MPCDRYAHTGRERGTAPGMQATIVEKCVSAAKMRSTKFSLFSGRIERIPWFILARI